MKTLILSLILPSLSFASCFYRVEEAPKSVPKEICVDSINVLPKNFVRIIGKKEGKTFSEVARSSLPKEMYAPGINLYEATLSYQKKGSENCFESIKEILIYWKTMQGQKSKILLQPVLRVTKALSPCGVDFETSEYPYTR